MSIPEKDTPCHGYSPQGLEYTPLLMIQVCNQASLLLNTVLLTQFTNLMSILISLELYSTLIYYIHSNS